jgi:hypothetical protein
MGEESSWPGTDEKAARGYSMPRQMAGIRKKIDLPADEYGWRPSADSCPRDSEE